MKVGADPVHLIDKADARHLISVRLPPDRLGLRLDAGDAVKYHQSPVEHPEAAFHLGGKVNVPRGIDDIDTMITPVAGGRRRGNGDTALPLLLHPVHDGGAFVYLTDFIGASGIIEYPLGDGCLTGIDMSDNAYVPDILQRKTPGHFLLSRCFCIFYINTANNRKTSYHL